MTFGTRFAVAYAVPRQVAPTVLAKTTADEAEQPGRDGEHRDQHGGPADARRRPAAWRRTRGHLESSEPRARSPRGSWAGSACARGTSGLVRPADPAGVAGPAMRSGGRGRAPAEQVQPAQGRGALDDLSEAHLFTGRGETDNAGQTALAGRGSVVAATPSIAPTAFAPASPSIARSPRSSASSARGRDRRRGQPGRAHRLRAPRRAAAACEQRDLDGPARPQVEQVQQVRPSGDQAGVDQHIAGGQCLRSAALADLEPRRSGPGPRRRSRRCPPA